MRRVFSLILACLAALTAGAQLGWAAPAPTPTAAPAKTFQSNGPSEATVAADGSGQYKTVQEAINAAPTGTPDHPSIIHVKPGTYKEIVYMQREKRFVRLLGENAATTVITYNLNANMPGLDGKAIGTFRTATATVDADDFTVENITVENSAGAVGQALALRVDGDRVTFRHCRFLGWQDTILANRGRQYFEDCDISGATDFIFGGATAFFDHCRLHSLGNGYLTAASTPDNQPYGFVFSHCSVDAASPDVKTYLGRPWRDFASVVFLNTELSSAVHPEGWSNWGGTKRDQTARYAEFQNTGPGADTAQRVSWAKQLTSAQALLLTPALVLGGSDAWNPVVTSSLQTDIEYGKADGESLTLDASVPPGKGSFPVAILVHGGGWSSGNKSGAGDIQPVFQPLTDAGFTWFSINYRLAPKSQWPAGFEDVQTAIRWVKAHAAEYKGDPNRIALIGYSAGAHLVCQAVVTATDATRVKAVVGLAAPTDLVADTARRGGLSPSLQNLFGRPQAVDAAASKILHDLSPINFVKPGLPPFLLIHGDADQSVPHEQSVNFQAKLKQNGVPCELITIPGAPHRISVWETLDPTYKSKMIAWLEKTLAGP